MDRSQRIAQHICQQILIWKQDHPRLVVAIDGYAGSGKTTVANSIAEYDTDVFVIHLDDFIQHWKERKQMIETATDRSEVFEHHWYRYDVIEQLLTAFLHGDTTFHSNIYNYERNEFDPEKTFDVSKNVLVIEGIFLLHTKHHLYPLIHKQVYLDADVDIADEQRIHREKQKWGDAYIPEDHPENWIQYFKVAYRRYLKTETPEKRADVIYIVE